MKNNSNKPPLLGQIYKLIIVALAIILILHYLYENSSLFYRKSIILPFSMHLNKQDLYLVKGEEFKLSVFAINKRVSYYSTNFRVAGVNFNGRVFAYQTGKAFIVAKVDGRELRCRVHVIDLNKKEITLRRGQSYRLRIKGSNSFVEWKSSNKGVATVSLFGNVKAVSSGTTVIYGKVKGKTLSCKVRVR